MSLQICPVCRVRSFTWVMVDQTLNSLTRWTCGVCYYSALEDESLERICKVCDTKSEIFLMDDEIKYWWCSNCKTERPSTTSKT